MPHPTEVLGDLAGAREEWPEYDDPTRKPYLRETDGHAKILFYFAKIATYLPHFTTASAENLLPRYMGRCLEGFLVFTYVNCYSIWIEECGSFGSGCGPLLLPDSPSPPASKKFTVYGRGTYTALTEYGTGLFNKLADVIGRQRLDKSNEVLADFDGQLKGNFWFYMAYPSERPTWMDYHERLSFEWDPLLDYSSDEDGEIRYSRVKRDRDAKAKLDKEIHQVDTKDEAAADTDEKMGYATI